MALYAQPLAGQLCALDTGRDLLKGNVSGEIRAAVAGLLVDGEGGEAYSNTTPIQC